MEYQEAVTLSKTEQERLKIIGEFRLGNFSRKDAALKLNIHERQVSRLAKKLREEGVTGIKHGNCGKTPWNKVPEELVEKYVKKYEEVYFNFNYLHALEMMELHEDMAVLSYTIFRKACRKKGIGKVKKRRTSKARLLRERHAEEGYLWQLDGSPEVWDGNKVSTLIALIDDATSKIPNAELHPTETTWACMKVVMKAILKYGRPEFILTDCAGWSEGSGRKRRHFSQFERACRELGITVIATISPESKGRVERLNRTWQDRLIPELDLLKITGLKDSNRYIDQVFMPEWNEKFTIEAKVETSRYRPLDPSTDLKEIFCLKHERVVNRNHTVCYANRIYQIFPVEGKNFKGKKIRVHEYEDKTISIFYGTSKLDVNEVKEPKRRWKNAS